MVVLLCLLLVWSASGLYSQSPTAPKAAPPASWPIESLTVAGNSNYSAEQIFAVAGLKTGEIAGPKEFEAARDRLAATGAFETIEFRFMAGPRGKGYAVVFHVSEAGPLFPVSFENLGASDAELKKYLRSMDPLFGELIPATEVIVERYSKAIENYLASSGRSVRVTSELIAEGSDPLKIVFHPDEELPRIAEVRFIGNDVIPSEALQKAIAGVAVGTLFHPKRFQQVLDASVRPAYEARGRVRVEFPDIRAEKASDVNGVIVTVQVSEGESYNLGQVRITGAPGPVEELMSIFGLKEGDLFQGGQVPEGIERIQKRLRREGYMKSVARPERRIDDEAKAVHLEIQIAPGPQFLFGKVKFKDLDLHAEAAVRRLWTLKPGQPFNADYPDFFLQRIREDEVFETLGKTRSSIQVNDETRTVDVTLFFR